MQSSLSTGAWRRRSKAAGVGVIRYRADIDGLRALAILSVIGYHAAPRLFPGGFVGVDVFFVISGFLITSLILREQAERRFGLAGFYLRRVLRLGPALVVMLASVLALGWWFLLPHEYHALRREMTASLWDYLQMMAAPDGGYGEGAVEEQPLVHLWTLAVEGLFYLAWPLVLLAVPERRRLAAVLVVIAVSFSASVLVTDESLLRAYYLPQFRVWQLGVGALAAVAARHWHGEAGRQMAGISSCAGLALIAGAVLTYTDRLVYPGWWALAPTLGAALLIGGGGEGWLNRRLFAAPAMVSVGLVSYALYLWHWPLLSIRNILDLDNDPWVTAVCLLTAAVLAWATYRFVEQPLRALPLPERLGTRRAATSPRPSRR